MRSKIAGMLVLAMVVALGVNAVGLAGERAGLVQSGENYLKGKKVSLMVKSQTAMFWVLMMNKATEMAKEMEFELEILAPSTPNSS